MYAILIDLDGPLCISKVDVCHKVVFAETECVVSLCSVSICTRHGSSRNSISAIETHLVLTSVHAGVVSRIVPICKGVAFADKYTKSVWRTISTHVMGPPASANCTYIMLVNIVVTRTVGFVLVGADKMGVSGHYMRLLVGVEQFKDILYVVGRSIEERNMNADNHHLILRHEGQILLQPLPLRVEDSRTVVGWRVVYRIDDVAHTDDVCISSVERVVYRAKHIFMLALSLQLEGGVALVGIDRLRSIEEGVVVVTHHLEYRESDTRLCKSVAHIVAISTSIGTCTIRDNIAKCDSVTWNRL